MIRDARPLGLNHGELSSDDLIGDRLMTKALVERRVTSQADMGGERGGLSDEAGVSANHQTLHRNFHSFQVEMFDL